MNPINPFVPHISPHEIEIKPLFEEEDHNDIPQIKLPLSNTKRKWKKKDFNPEFFDMANKREIGEGSFGQVFKVKWKKDPSKQWRNVQKLILWKDPILLIYSFDDLKTISENKASYHIF